MTMSTQLAQQYEADAEKFEEVAKEAVTEQSASYWREEAERARAAASRIRGTHG